MKDPEAGEHGGHWGIRVSGTPAVDGPDDVKTTILLALTLEGLGHLQAVGEATKEDGGVSGNVEFEGSTVELGDFKIVVADSKGNNHPTHDHPSGDQKPLDKSFVRSATVHEDGLWQQKQVMFANMKEQVDKYVEDYGQENIPPPEQLYTVEHQAGVGNIHFVQKVFEGPFQFDVLFSSGSAEDPMTAETLSKQAVKALKGFEDRYGEILKPQAPFGSEKYTRFTKSLFSNLVGGIGYFYGDQRIDRSYADEYLEESEGFWEEAAEARGRADVKLEGPTELFTSIPSRPFFPRGFLWDEGFHLLPILDWDAELTLQIVQSWFNLADEDGWIPREVILGPEARSKVPEEFQVQYPHYANPPTLYVVLNRLLDKVESGDASGLGYLGKPESVKASLKDLYPLLKRHYNWWRRTQKGDLKTYDREAYSNKEAYRWRSRTPRHILTSGLDDYPRAQPPHPGELHLDAISWVGLMARSMKRIATFLGDSEDASEFATHETSIAKNIDDLHWDEKEKMYCDATIDDYEDHVHVCHKGYISLFPFMTGLLGKDSPKVDHVLDLIADPEHLWSPHGIRSLSKSSEFYGTDENYWRSPVWMNMNYLIIEQLLVSHYNPSHQSLSNITQNLATHKGPYQDKAKKIYMVLRQNLVDTVYKSWEDTGFAWEQYNPETGAGQRTQHFTGWTSLIVKIMAMPDLKKSDGHEEL